MSTHLLLLVLILFAGYLAHCVFWPDRVCRPCEGTGRLLNASRTAARLCRRCNGHGAYPRFGRRLITGWRRLRRNNRNRY